MSSVSFPEQIIESIMDDEIVRLQAGIIEYEVRLAKAYSSDDEKSEVEKIVYPVVLVHLRRELKDMVGFMGTSHGVGLSSIHRLHGRALDSLEIGKAPSEGLEV
ncbi:MAG: hypothetical protein F7C32_00905 [Desulfurococcales archaeon]|nr:hypothetical protein [Desulfurococcales archaeon]